MNKLEDLRTNIADLPEAELRERIRAIRANRRAKPTRKSKKAKKDPLEAMLEGLSEEELEKVKLELLGGDLEDGT